VAVLWKSPKNETHSFAILGSKSLIPATGDRWYISFTSDGICLIDSNGEMLLRREQKVDDQATWTMQYLSRMKDADFLRQLWEHHVPEGQWNVYCSVSPVISLDICCSERKSLNRIHFAFRRRMPTFNQISCYLE
jgi:hypothetical protein